MMRLLCVLLLLQTACATIFTGTHQEVAVASTPPANVVVVSGTAANLALRAGEMNELKNKLVAVIAPALTPGQKKLVDLMQPDELVTRLVLELTPAFKNAPPNLVETSGHLLAALPDSARDTLRDLIGIETVGRTPLKLDLPKGEPFAVVTWAPGHRARLLTIDTTFNWVVLANVLTLGLGAIVDVLDGAWLDLTPVSLQYSLAPIASPVAPAAPLKH